MDQPECAGSRKNHCLITNESVFARYISSLKDQRVAASKVLSGRQAQPAGDKTAEFIEKFVVLCTLGKIVSYAGGFSQLRAASERLQLGSELRRNQKIFPVLAASSVRSSCRKSPMICRKSADR